MVCFPWSQWCYVLMERRKPMTKWNIHLSLPSLPSSLISPSTAYKPPVNSSQASGQSVNSSSWRKRPAFHSSTVAQQTYFHLAKWHWFSKHMRHVISCLVAFILLLILTQCLLHARHCAKCLSVVFCLITIFIYVDLNIVSHFINEKPRGSKKLNNFLKGHVVSSRVKNLNPGFVFLPKPLEWGFSGRSSG